MAQHRDSVETETESKARVLLGIDAAVLEHVRVHRTATADFHPARALATAATLATAEHAAHVHFCRRFREREEARAETRLDAFAEQLVHEHLEHALQVSETDVFIDHQAFALLEHRGVGRIVIDAEHVARSNHAERRLVRFHVVDLRAGSVRTQHHLVVHVERVLHVAARMVGRRVERLEVVPVRLDVAAEVHLEAHLAEEVDNLFAHVVERVRAAGGNARTGEAHIHKTAFQLLLEGGLVRGLDSLVDGLGDGDLKFVHELAVSRTFLGAERAHLLHEVGDGPLLAEVLHAEVVDGFLVCKVGLRKFCVKRLLHIVDSFTHSDRKFRKWLLVLLVFICPAPVLRYNLWSKVLQKM